MDDSPNTPLVCPSTVTVRRNPHRRARPTPSSSIGPRKLPFFPPTEQQEPISSFPTQDILSVELPPSAARKPRKLTSSENLRVFLRIRPLTISTKLAGKRHAGGDSKNVWPKNGKAKNSPKPKAKESKGVCVAAAKDSSSVTITPPESLVESKRVKMEIYEGFSRVFSDEASQSEVYEKMVHPLVEEFLKGKSGMLAALGPSGSGKTHTVFGSVRDPGMVPLMLRHIFSRDEGSKNLLKGAFSLSMFEIRSEKGKSERLYDLLHEGSEVQIQQSVIKGLDEVIINDVLQAESWIACGMLRRSTAATNTNTQSSRSQCIINISYSIQKEYVELEGEQEKVLFTIVDLAGAEREKKTGNQGLRMAESNFINNTSMVFGLCLRSLLEHQKNQRKPLQKHFQNSLLTKYLRDYLEGKKRMALILTVKPGEDDYPETSNLLKQGAPFAQIKFANIEETGNQKCAKRAIQNFPDKDNGKRMKFSASGKKNVATGSHGDQADEPQRQTKESCGIVEADKDVKLKELVAKSEDPLLSKVNDGSTIKVDPIDLARREREHLITTNFNRALWAVLKEYKGKLEIAQSDIVRLRDSLTCEKKRSSQLEFQLKDLKFTCSGDGESAKVSIPSKSAACIGTDSSEEQQQNCEQQKKQENSRVSESLAELHGESKDLQVVDIYLDTGATVSIASQIDANSILEEAGIDDVLSEIRSTGCLEACSFSEEKESTVPTAEEDLAILDATALNDAVCSLSVEKDSPCSDAIFPESFACSTSAEMESTTSAVINSNCPPCFSEVIVPGSPAAELEACSFSEEKESTVPTAEKDLAILDAAALNGAVYSLAIEKDTACSDVISPESFACSTLAEMDSAISAVIYPDCPSFSPAEKDSALSEVLVPDTVVLDSPAAEIESTTHDVILLDTPTCYPSPEKESEIVAVSVPHSPSSSCVILIGDSGDTSSPIKMDQVPREQSKNEAVNQKKPGSDVILIEHNFPAATEAKRKPRRKLQPIAANLLRNVIDLEVDEIRHPKGFKALGSDMRNRSKGNTTLSRLLSLR